MFIHTPQTVGLVTLLLIGYFGDAFSAAASPPGFKRIQLTNTPKDVEFNPRINDLGDVVWSSRIGGFNNEKNEEIFLWVGGTTSRLTSDNYRDTWPDINNSGVIVWSRASGPEGKYGPSYEIARWESEHFEVLTENELEDYGPLLGERGEIVWYQETGLTCLDAAVFGIRQFKDGQVESLYDNYSANTTPVILSGDRIAWIDYDWCADPVTTKLMVQDSEGQIATLVDGPFPRRPSIAPNGLMAWANEGGIEVFRDGEITKVLNSGEAAMINSRGDIAFILWSDRLRTWQTWLYIGGETRLLASATNWEWSNDMNERGDIVIMSCTKALDKSEIILLQRLPDGDMNCDENVDFDDIDGFVEAITDRAVYEKNNKTCDWWLADCNGDRKIDFNDIDAFVDCLINNGCP